MRQRVAAVVAALVVAAAGCGDQREFTTEQWRGDPLQAAADCFHKDFRKPFVRDVVKNVLQEGMTRAEVRTLLGPPDFAITEPFAGTVDGWYYEIGLRESDCMFCSLASTTGVGCSSGLTLAPPLMNDDSPVRLRLGRFTQTL
jgi:hypothetical protein